MLFDVRLSRAKRGHAQVMLGEQLFDRVCIEFRRFAHREFRASVPERGEMRELRFEIRRERDCRELRGLG